MIIDLEKIYTEVALRTYYLGELPKKENPDASLIQTSSDTNDVLYGFAKEAVYDVVSLLADRLDVSFSDDTDIQIEVNVENELRKKLLEEAINRYVYSYVLYHWLLLAFPNLAPPFFDMLQKSLDMINTQRTFLSGKVRRRPTDLAGC